MPTPSQIPCPALNTGVTTHGVTQLAGELTLMLLLPHPLVAVAVNTTSVPTGIPVTVFPETIPDEAVTVPVLLNVML